MIDRLSITNNNLSPFRNIYKKYLRNYFAVKSLGAKAKSTTHFTYLCSKSPTPHIAPAITQPCLSNLSACPLNGSTALRGWEKQIELWAGFGDNRNATMLYGVNLSSTGRL